MSNPVLKAHVIRPDPSMIAAFVEMAFDGLDGWAAVRCFPEKGGSDQAPRCKFHNTGCDLAAALEEEAGFASASGLACFVVPGTVGRPGSAKAVDVIAIRSVVVDLDHGDIQAKRDHLAGHLGTPSMEVASGGRTHEEVERLHLHWRLSEPVTGDEVRAVCELRHAIAQKVGGDTAFQSAHQPIRLPGSVYRKGNAERLCEIREHVGAEYELAYLREAADRMPALAGIIVREASPTTLGRLMVTPVHEGGADGISRFEALSRAIGHWVRQRRLGTVSWDQAWEEIQSYNEACVRPPWPLDRLRQETDRLIAVDDRNHPFAEGDAAAPPSGSQDALAESFSCQYGDEWRHVPVWGKWLKWCGTRWCSDDSHEVRHTIRLLCRAHAAESDTGQKSMASASTISSVDRLARSDPRHARRPEDWDRDPWLLNTLDGSVDLRTGIASRPDPADEVTKITGAGPSGDCPTWHAFLEKVTGENVELQTYLQRVAGYCLTGLTSEHALFFLYGTGANGKSVFTSTLDVIFGDYAEVAPIEMLMSSSGDRHPTELAKLRGARFVTAVETERDRAWAESKLKVLTGGDRITARFMHCDFFEYTPQFKLLVAGNHKPVIKTVDEAMRRRLHLIPFTVTIPPAERDPDLSAKLLREADGILAWAVEGCLGWQRDGLCPPEIVRRATDEYFETEDAIGRWLDETCDLDLAARESSSTLYGSWRNWAEGNGETPGSMKSFASGLSGRFTPYRRSRERGFLGLRLRPNSDLQRGLGR